MIFARIVFFILLLMAPAQAAATTNVTLNYNGFWGGMEAGKLSFALRENARNFSGEMQLRTTGFLQNLLRLHVIAKTEGESKRQKFTTLRYNYTSIRRKKTKTLGWQWDKAAQMARTPDYPHLEKIVTPEWRKNVIDPLAALVQTMRSLRASKGADSTALRQTVAVFDGRRRFDVAVIDYKKTSITLVDKTQSVIALTLAVTPKAGFDAEDREAEIWAKAKIQIFLADDGRYYPIRAVADTSLGPAIIQLSGGCLGAPPCAAGKTL